MSKYVSSILLLAVGSVLGFLVAVVRYSGFDYDGKINAAQLLNLLVSLLIALVVNSIFQRDASTKAIRRQLLLEHVKEIRENLEATYQAFVACPISKKIPKEASQGVSQSERQFSNSMHSLETALGFCHLRLGKEFQKLKELRFELKEVLTDSPFPNGSYTQARADQITAVFKTVREQSTRVLFEINDICH